MVNTSSISASRSEVKATTEQRLCRVIDVASIAAAIVVDAQRVVVEWSGGAAAMLGWTEPEATGRCLEALMPPIMTLPKTDKTPLEMWLPRKDGSRLWAQIETQPVPDGLGAPRHCVYIILDRTREHEAFESLRPDRTRFWELSADLMVIAGLDGTIQELNPAWQQCLHCTGSDLLGTSLLDLVHPEDRTAALEDLTHLRHGHPWREVKHRYRRQDGNYRWICWNAVRDRSMLYAVGRDVTAAMEQAETLSQYQPRLRAIFESIYQYQGLLEPDGTVVNANPTSLAAIEAEAADVVGRKLWETPWFNTTPGMSQKVREAVEAVAAGSSLRQEITLNLPAGQTILDFSLRPVFDAQGGVTAIVPEAIDLSQRREAEARLRQAQKMEAVGQLTSGLAHDFNNLLTGIMGSLELLQLRLHAGRTDQLDGYITAALGAAGRAASLTHRLLAFSRRQTLDPKPAHADRLVGEMEDLVRRTVGPSIALETELGQDLWPIFCDPNQLENALLNLCINARDAMPDGGRLTIRASNAAMTDRQASERGMIAGDYVAVSVTDTGAGMTPDVLTHAFDPFFTTKPLGQGTGLGLSMIYGFVRQSGGHVQINSHVGQGTVVTLYMPRHMGLDRQTLSIQQPVAPPRAAEGQTVVVVDDEPTVRHLVVEALRNLGYATIEAEDGSSGLAVLLSSARIDLLVTDVGLPGGMNGRQLAEAAQQMRPDLKVLFITGYAESALVDDGQLQAGMHVLIKPFAIETLASRIKAILG